MNQIFMGLMIMVIGVGFVMGGLAFSLSTIKDRLYPNGNTQPLATVCEVEKKIKDIKPAEKEERWATGYIVNKGGKKEEVRKIEEANTEVKIDYVEFLAGWGSYTKTKWIPKKDYYPYYTLEQLSEIINKTRK